MIRGLIVFEDARWADLQPLTDALPTPALAFGAGTLASRWMEQARLPLAALEARAAVAAAWAGPAVTARPADSDEVLAVNAVALPGAWLDQVRGGRTPAVWLAHDRVVAARAPWSALTGGLGRGDFERFLLSLGIPTFAVEAPVLRFAWDLIEHNPIALARDLDEPGSIAGEVHATAVMLEPQRISIAAGARIEALTVLDARAGPIRIGARAVIQSHSLVIGPCAIGDGTQILGGVVGNSTFGPQCRIAGEVDACIWQGYANKRHHGFVGHSVIGEWVNLGALTTTSDLKNNYGEVKVWVGERELATGSNKVGSILGAHVKTGIGTLLPTGAAIGVGANLFGGGRFAPKRVVSFAWWDGERTVEHELEKFLATARIAMSRRARELLAADENLWRQVHAATRRKP